MFFDKGISQKLNVTTRLKVELVYFENVVQHISQYDTRIPHSLILGVKEWTNVLLQNLIFIIL